MIVQLTGSSRNLEKDLPFLKKIIEVIHDNDGLLARDWLGAAHTEVIKTNWRNEGRVDWNDIFQDTIESIARADLVVTEATRYGYMQGYYTAIAIERKKPTLVIRRKDGASGNAIFGVTSQYLTIKEYETLDQLEKIVDSFIKKSKPFIKKIEIRIPLQPATHNFVSHLATTKNQSKEQIINDILERESQHSSYLDQNK